ncbi:DUF4239 domain-containing protein [Candidatus Gottesmanbacteria bacterium]|nr:DUF4239 domain-containing protein [Candidatus Gottesmanbacteria bacterium]
MIFKTDSFLADVGGINNFVSLFGTLYGIMAAFIVFEVWGEYNGATKLIDEEALGMERLYRLTLYFRDNKLSQMMKKAINKYIDLVINREFPAISKGERDKETSKVFREIFSIINNIKFDDDHDQTVFDHVLEHYGKLGEMRTNRVNQSLTRLPNLLKVFFYLSSFFALLIFVLRVYKRLLIIK